MSINTPEGKKYNNKIVSEMYKERMNTFDYYCINAFFWLWGEKSFYCYFYRIAMTRHRQEIKI